MLLSISEGVLLDKAVAMGLVSAADVAEARNTQTASPITRKWGLVLDRLIAQGKLTEAQLRRLQEDLSSAAPGSPALDRTMDGGLEQTLGSEAGGPTPTITVAPTTFPAPHWDKYEFVELLGRGGMGAVYKARDRRLGRLVALKFIHGDDPGMIQRFLQEARSQARLDHPFICKVYEVGTVDNKPYIAMELVEGRTLDRMSSQLGLSEKIQVLKDAAAALHAAHEQGIIHRDIKPSNIMVERTPSGSLRPVIMDFGLARESGDSHGLTESGAVMGTPAYMSPEQARGEARRLDRRSDVYSLGATMYDVLCGKPPFEDQTVLNILLKVMNEPPSPLRSLDPTIPEAIELVVSKCLNKEPAQRYQSAKALADDLGRYLSAQQVEAKRLSYSYRFRYWARHNKTLATLGAVLLVTVLSATGFGIRARFIAIQKERRAKEQAELARWIGQSVKDLEWVARTAYLLPLHDTSYEKQLVRDRMAEIETELKRHPDIGPRLGAYARGRGLLALHEWKPAYEELQQAERLGHKDLELDYALGRALGALYSQALDDARKSGDKSFFEKRKAELDEELLRPALSYLERSRGLRSVSSTYVEGLVAYYQEQYDQALQSADKAYKQAPWMYEAVELGGDVFLSRARAQRDRGEHDPAEQSFAESVKRYKQAAEIGRSDHNVHEALAEAYIRWEELEFYRGKNPEPYLQEALAAADRALVAAPKESHGHTKKAFAYYFQSQYSQKHRDIGSAIKYCNLQLAEAKQSLLDHPSNAYAHESAGISSFRLAELEPQDVQKSLDRLKYAYDRFESATRLNPRFPWAYNDYAIALIIESKRLTRQGISPLDNLTKSIELAKQSNEIDPSYIYALNTISLASQRAINWSINYSGDVQQWAKYGIQAINQALKLNPNYTFAHGNLGTIYLHLALFESLSGSPTNNPSKLAILSYQSMAKVDGSSAELDSYIATAHYYSAIYLANSNQDPSQEISEGLSTLSKCASKETNDPYCADIQARLLSVRSEWARQQAHPYIADLERAYSMSQQALRKIDDEPESLLAFSEIAYQLTHARRQQGKSPVSNIQQGLMAADKALTLMNNWPRALAIKGALLLERSRTEKTKAQKRDSISNAHQALLAAIKNNPLLQRKYGGILEETERLQQEQREERKEPEGNPDH